MMKKILVIVIIFVMTILFLVYPENCLQSAKAGLDIWLGAVLPSLLPFMVASFVLLETGVVRFIAHLFAPATRVLFAAPGEGAYVFFSAAFSGYPVGARLASELYAKKQISESDALAIIRFTSVSGPVYITGAVSAGLLGMPEAGVYLAVTHYLSAILVGIIFGLFANRPSKKVRSQNGSMQSALHRFKEDIAQSGSFGDMMASGIEKAITTLLKIGGFIVFFYVLIEILSVTGVLDAAGWVYSPIASLSGLDPGSTRAMLYGGIELTAGCREAALLDTDITAKLPVVAAIIAFGGLSVHMQTKAVCVSSGLRPKRFMLAKSLQALLAYMFCAISLKLFPMTVAAASFQPQIKTAAYYGIVFAAVSFIILLIIKRVQKSSALTFTRKF